ncbi:hypothetical protein HDU93_006916, partial [Gonapodya sp. JEL0774]
MPITIYHLLNAIESSDVYKMKRVMMSGLDPNARKRVIVRVIMEDGGNIAKRDEALGESALTLAIRGGDVDILESLLKA